MWLTSIEKLIRQVIRQKTIETKVYPGFQIGAFFNYNLHKEFSLTTELNFSLLGSKTKYTRTDFIVNPDGSISGATSGYYNDKIYQLEIPVFIKYNISRVSMGIGPMVGIKLSSTIDDYQDSSFKNTYYRPIDFGINAVMDYSLNNRIGVNVKYNYGVTDNDEREYSVVKNRYLCFAITYIF